jgi:trans-aconitate methyltransferase
MRTVPLHTRDWEEMAAIDPFWAIMSSPEKRFRNWELEEFLSTGQEEVFSLMEAADKLGLPKERRRAIDFGCGVGRLTRALRSHFPECYGIDISEGMLERARELTPECQFRQANDLRSFPDRHADLIYSSMVLQHQPNKEQAAALITEMVRVLAPAGLLVFQMPVHVPFRNKLQIRRRAYRLLRALGISHSFAYDRLKLSPIRMVALPQPAVEKIVRAANGEVLRVVHTTRFSSPLTSGIYYCTVKSRT